MIDNSNESKRQHINSILASFNIRATCKDVSEQKNTCHFDLSLSPGTLIRSIEKRLPELSLAIRSPNTLSLQLLNDQGLLRLQYLKGQPAKIGLFDLGNNLPRPKGKLTSLLGETMEGDPLWLDLAECPNLLIAGTTGSGKSTVLHTIIANLLLHPSASIVLFDPKSIEFQAYKQLSPSRRVSVSFDFPSCLSTLEGLCRTMEQRYQVIRNGAGNEPTTPHPIVLIIDEFASLIQEDSERKFHTALCSLSSKSRAANIFTIIATQRPSVDLISGTIKANFPSRIACKVSSSIDSRVILDSTGAEQLLGKGDSLIKSGRFDKQRFQAAYVSPDELVSIFGGK